MNVDDIVFFAVINVNLTLISRMIQGFSPIKINLSKIREYEAPFGVSLKVMKVIFMMLMLYMGVPLSLFFASEWVLTIMYIVYWYVIVLWWYYYSLCLFDRCLLASSATSLSLLACMTFFFYSHEWAVTTWIPVLCWSFFTLYISIWYNKSYSNNNIIVV